MFLYFLTCISTSTFNNNDANACWKRRGEGLISFLNSIKNKKLFKGLEKCINFLVKRKEFLYFPPSLPKCFLMCIPRVRIGNSPPTPTAPSVELDDRLPLHSLLCLYLLVCIGHNETPFFSFLFPCIYTYIFLFPLVLSFCARCLILTHTYLPFPSTPTLPLG